MRSKQKIRKPYLVETFDVKVNCIDEGDRLDVRLLVQRKDHGETKLGVLMVKKNEIKDVTFDILNLQRYNYILNSTSDVYTSITGSMMFVLAFIIINVCKMETDSMVLLKRY